MKIPPLEWNDLINMGMDPNSTISLDDRLNINPMPAKLLYQLLSSLIRDPTPDSSDNITYLRHVRDILISLTDYTQMNDVPLSNSQKEAWANYRQQLRDLPQNYSGNGPISWPVIPS